MSFSVPLQGLMKRSPPGFGLTSFVNSVLMGVRRGRITQADARDEVFALAERHNLTVYDAAYLDLPIRRALPLATLDTALIRAAGQAGVTLVSP